MKPSIGRIVHHVNGQGAHEAAIISRVFSDTCVNLHVMQDDDTEPFRRITSVLQDEIVRPNSWHWPERE
jgi:hypothetical protein